ncbi:MAG: DUF4162 domain-containing protein [Chitinophagales bacterium]|nr:DUF4162 domain-containing protein [Chitinophagales bacterium]
MRENGATIIFSTHRMEQVEEICEKIVLINNGRIILNGNVEDLKQQFKGNLFQIDFAHDRTPELPAHVELIDTHEGTLIVQLHNSDSNSIIQNLINQGVDIKSFNEILPSINEIFIKQVNQSHG